MDEVITTPIEDSNGKNSPANSELRLNKKIPNIVIILLVVFLDIFGVGLAMPLVSPLIKELGASPMQLGLLSSVYGAVQLISGPFMGLVSDIRGRKTVILIAFLGTTVGYLLLGYSSTLQLVALSRVITGCLKHSQNAIKAYVADHTTRENRAVELGRIATASGLGIMVGPAVGGFLFKLGGYPLPVIVASSFFFLNSIIVATFLEGASKTQDASTPRSHLQFMPNLSMLLRPAILSLFVVRLIMGIAVMTFREGISLLVLYRFKISVRGNGMLISYQGLLATLVQGFALKPLTKTYQTGSLLYFGMSLLGLSFFGVSLSPNLVFLVILLTPVALSSGVLRTTFAAVLTSIVPQNEVGQILGLSDATMSVCRVVGPALGGAIASWTNARAPCVFSALLMCFATAVFHFTGCTNLLTKRRLSGIPEDTTPLLNGEPSVDTPLNMDVIGAVKSDGFGLLDSRLSPNGSSKVLHRKKNNE